MRAVEKELFGLQDEKYKEFQSRLIPEIDKNLIIGVRTPQLRKYAKGLDKEDGDAFISELPHKYYDENNLHAFIIEKIKDFDRAVFETERFLPYIDNWATCDIFSPSVFKKNTDRLLEYVRKWIKSDRTYTVRYGVGMLLGLYLDDKFTPDLPELAAAVSSEEYYVNMMLAWYFATALAKQYDTAIAYLTERRLSTWVHNKTIRKAIESRRIDDDTKKYLRSLSI